jgi:hypothetical protein
VEKRNEQRTAESFTRKEKRQGGKVMRLISENEILGNILSAINKLIYKQ